jgi:hypothetical protein
LASGNRADFNAAGNDDLALAVAAPGGGTQLDVFYAPNSSASFVPSLGKWSSPTDPNKIVHTVSGDFNADGSSDVAAFVDAGSGSSRLDVWLGPGLSGPTSWWTGASFPAANELHTLPGDFDGDGKSDVAAIRWFPGTTTFKIWLFYSDGTKFSPTEGWTKTSGYTGDLVLHAASGDFNGDCRSDIATFYDYGSSETRIHVFLAQPDKTLAYQGSSGWWAVPSGYSLDRVAHVTAGDFDDDGLSDLVAMHHYSDPPKTRLHVWLSTGSEFSYSGSSGWLEIPDGAGFYPPRVVRLVPGDFDRKSSQDTDLVAVYREPGGAIKLLGMLSSKSGHYFTSPTEWPHGLTDYAPDVRASAPGSTRLQTDLVPPVTSALAQAVGAPAAGEWTRGSWKVTLSCSDPLSACERTEYSLDGGPAQPYAAPISVADEGRHELRYRSLDGAGNWETWQGSLVLGVDRTAPVSVLEPPPPVVLSGQQLTLRATAEDPPAGNPPGASGVAKVTFLVCPVPAGECRSYTDSDGSDGWSVTVTDVPAGVYLVNSAAEDKVGNGEDPSAKAGAVVVELN